jgi:hypothetical protein
MIGKSFLGTRENEKRNGGRRKQIKVQCYPLDFCKEAR